MNKFKLYMIKKYIFGIIVILSLATSVCYAGDVPESLLGSDDAKIFFGEVLAYHPNNNVIEVHPVKNVKGDIVIGSKQIFEGCEPIINFVPKAGDVYLMTYYDENNPLNVFEVTSYDTKTLKIKNIERLDMWSRIQQFLNDGSYEAAETRRLEKLGETAYVPAQTKLPPLKNNTTKIICISVAVMIVLIVLCWFLIKNKSKNKVVR